MACTCMSEQDVETEQTKNKPAQPKEVTTTIEINKDPYYCTTVGGVKKCYTY